MRKRSSDIEACGHAEVLATAAGAALPKETADFTPVPVHFLEKLALSRAEALVGGR